MPRNELSRLVWPTIVAGTPVHGENSNRRVDEWVDNGQLDYGFLIGVHGENYIRRVDDRGDIGQLDCVVLNCS